MESDIIYYARKRYTTKSFNPDKKIPAEDVEKIKELLRYSPSSINSQPWHFILASTTEGKQRIAKSAERVYPANQKSILSASHVVVFCSKLELDESYLVKLIEQEEQDGRFAADEKYKARQLGARNLFVNLHKDDYKDLQHWLDKQVYLNLGQFLLGVATLGIDATPMEGIEVAVLDQEFSLRDKGYGSLVVVSLGYQTEDDFNAKLPKSRWPYTEILTEV